MIGIDLRFVAGDIKKFGKISSGVGIFCQEVLKGFEELDCVDNFVLIINSCQIKFAQEMFPLFKYMVFDKKTRYHNSILLKIDRYRFEKEAKRHNISLLWFPFATPYYYLDTNIPCISTIHDLIILHERPNDRRWYNGFKQIINNSNKIIVVSEFVKNDVAELYSPNDMEKIQVISNPVTVNISDMTNVADLKDKVYILDINAYQPRKNGETLIKAYSRIAKNTLADLVFCGGYNEEGHFELLQEMAKSLGLNERIHFYLAVSTAQRNWLLKNAFIVVSPTLSEGFGRTPIEAAIAGNMVICTKVDSLYEVTKGLLHYYDDPKNELELSEKIRSLLENPDTQEKLTEIANELSNAYSQKRIAGEYFRVFEQVNNE